MTNTKENLTCRFCELGWSKWGHTFVLLSFRIILAQVAVSD